MVGQVHAPTVVTGRRFSPSPGGNQEWVNGGLIVSNLRPDDPNPQPVVNRLARQTDLIDCPLWGWRGRLANPVAAVWQGPAYHEVRTRVRVFPASTAGPAETTLRPLAACRPSVGLCSPFRPSRAAGKTQKHRHRARSSSR